MAGQIGRLRHRVTIQSVTRTRDSYGDPIETWATTHTVWANIEPQTGRERVAAAQIVAETDVMIRIRYVAGILPTMQVVEGSDVYDILAVRNLYGRDRWLELFCRAQPVSTVIPSVGVIQRITSTGARRVTSTGSIRITA